MREGWSKDKIANICTFFGDGDWIESKDQSEDGIRLIQTGNIGNGYYIDKEDKPHYITEETFNKLNCTEIVEGDCLISRLPRPLGRSCLVPKLKSKAITAVDCTILRFKDFCLPQFFVYFTQSPLYNLAVSQDSTGSTRKRISRKNLGFIEIPLPPLATQQQIVSELDLLSHILDQKRQQLKEYDALAESIFYDMFGDPVENPKGWEVKKFSDVFAIKTGKLDSNAMVNNGKYPFFTCSKEVFSINEYAFDCEALLLAGNNASGNYDVKYYKGKFNAYQRTYVLTTKDNNEYSVLKIQLEKRLVELKQKSLGINTKYLTLKILDTISLILPPLTLQRSFAAKIESIEHQKQLLRASIKETEMLFQSRMDYWFNG